MTALTPREVLAKELRLALGEARPGQWLHIESSPWEDLPHERKTKWLHMAAAAERAIADRGPEYPRQSGLEDASGPYTDIGPECFVTADGRELCYKGENYIRQSAVTEWMDELNASHPAEHRDDIDLTVGEVLDRLEEIARPPAERPVTRTKKGASRG